MDRLDGISEPVLESRRAFRLEGGEGKQKWEEEGGKGERGISYTLVIGDEGEGLKEVRGRGTYVASKVFVYTRLISN